jgi:hypothetical protein
MALIEHKHTGAQNAINERKRSIMHPVNFLLKSGKWMRFGPVDTDKATVG